ncbi:hypothetical protein HK100_010859 [Physocladia obscura]|uniref:Uncharacterized protein n=1 Tax=Physocladia obscura TaxID=109957 RepID=A0AAD5XDM7_9FUNG|nr:hypothetical protein HK100_010859 [Physocladia obscura]
MSVGPRILALHGSRQTADIFRERLQRLEDELVAEGAVVVYINGPVELALEPGDSVALRSWFVDKRCGGCESGGGCSLNDDNDNDAGSVCVCAALQSLRDTWRRLGPFDGIIAFSAGAQAATLVAQSQSQSQSRLSSALLGLSWLLLCGAPPPPPLCRLETVNPLETQKSLSLLVSPHIRSLHVYGARDTLVTPSSSCAFANAVFHNSSHLLHDQAHSFPVRRHDIEQYLSFIHHACVPLPEFADLRVDEIASLEAIYPDELEIVSADSPYNGIQIITYSVESEHNNINIKLKLVFRLSSSYPATFPSISIVHEMGMLEFSCSTENALLNAIHSAIFPLLGSVMIFDAISAATQFLDYLNMGAITVPELEQISDTERDSAVNNFLEISPLPHSSSNSMSNFKSKNSRGKWKHTIGLVGKPSAGKSTFFNAATKSLQAKMASHPFTTIDPNVAQGDWTVPSSFVPKKWIAEGKEVTLPCVIKDVAGLVPGAWEGRGRGNKFLNDLCDADVLIHIVDASGLSDSDGNILPEDTPTPTDPLQDIKWVRNELFQWIYNNIHKKWDSILKRPERLPGMFSGYHAPQWLVAEVLESTGFNPAVQPQYARQFWSVKKLEDAVNQFLDARFPMLLAMNKAEMTPSAGNIERVRKVFGSDVGASNNSESVQIVVPVCAVAELWLQGQQAAGTVEYIASVFGSKTIVVQKAEFETDQDQEQWKQVEKLIDMFNGTGVNAALSAAVMMRPPVFCYPVQDLDSLKPIVHNGSNGSCLTMKPGSTVNDVFELLAHGSDATLAGQFVRAEAVAFDGLGKRPVRKDNEVDDNIAIIKFMSNRKSRWQSHANKG